MLPARERGCRVFCGLETSCLQEWILLLWSSSAAFWQPEFVLTSSCLGILHSGQSPLGYLCAKRWSGAKGCVLAQKLGHLVVEMWDGSLVLVRWSLVPRPIGCSSGVKLILEQVPVGRLDAGTHAIKRRGFSGGICHCTSWLLVLFCLLLQIPPSGLFFLFFPPSPPGGNSGQGLGGCLMLVPQHAALQLSVLRFWLVAVSSFLHSFLRCFSIFQLCIFVCHHFCSWASRWQGHCTIHLPAGLGMKTWFFF